MSNKATKLPNTKCRSTLPEWSSLEEHAKTVGDEHICQLFDNDPDRFNKFHLKHGPMLLDFSKQLLDDQTLEKLNDYAKACNLEQWRDQMFDGAIINTTENRAVLHTALRAKPSKKICICGNNIAPKVQKTLDKMKSFSDNIRSEKRFTDIVNIGIGGSDLGTAMAYEALRPFTDRDINLHFVSNVDSTHISEVLRKVNPQKTLFIIASKTFTTQETMTNANSARDWLRKELGKEDVSECFIAVSRNETLAKEFGIREENIFRVWDWVGGRFSLWSAVGLPLCIALGFEQFSEMLAGARAMDEHFISAPIMENMPVMLGLIGMWNRNFLGHESLAIVPYDQYLHRLPAYLQQLDMESNGKSIDRQDKNISYKTGPIVFGEAGANAQHAFFQLIHQGTTIIPCEFIVSAKSQNPIGDHQDKLIANAFAQSKALMEGQDNDDMHKVFEGNRPSSTLLIDEINPHSLGMLIALYEHKIFVQGVLWNINSFDQCGVELGKDLANQILNCEGDNSKTDPSTQSLIEAAKKIS